MAALKDLHWMLKSKAFRILEVTQSQSVSPPFGSDGERKDQPDQWKGLLVDEDVTIMARDQKLNLVDTGGKSIWRLREDGIPTRTMGGNRWLVDHLFLDQDGIPILVKVRRGSGSRIRREVVGQMLNYAANALVYWPHNAIQLYFEGSW